MLELSIAFILGGLVAHFIGKYGEQKLAKALIQVVSESRKNYEAIERIEEEIDRQALAISEQFERTDAHISEVWGLLADPELRKETQENFGGMLNDLDRGNWPPIR